MRYGERYVMVKFDTMNWKVPVGLGVLACVFAAFGNPEIFNRDTFRGVVALTGIVAMIWGIDLRRRNEHLQREAERRAEMRRGGVMFNTSRTVIRPAKDPEVTQRAADRRRRVGAWRPDLAGL